jgi:hypothetical protein
MAVARRIVEQELAQILSTAERYVGNYLEEKQIIHERLARRYDPGMALNEAFNRVAEKIEEAKPAEAIPLSGKQQAALKFQQEFLRANVKRGPS